ncbi:SIS domain-containing protein [Brevundimonas sp.]|uniref:D-sedoheptulose-7-phosphate isomerase n=1 Tax=Brevundimonas sp. TaxID=1871086 RepID=UPI001ACDBB8F|nr:SIS domain-containing protein [Brevundimonas sp.]MBN9464770.1 SIS domain-containing protein [Brevundimonas sp.]
MTYFPDRVHDSGSTYATRYFALLAEAYKTVDAGAVTAAGQLLVEASKARRTIFSCGNGGSAAISNHLVCDCLKGVRSNTSLRPKVYSLSATVELVTAIVNDIGVEQMFSFQLESLASKGDVLVAISSSGASPNIVAALRKAREIGMKTIAMTGFSGGAASELSDVSLHVRAENYGIIEDTHQSLMHILAQYMRQSNMDQPELLGSLKF